tara:strand:- start:198 stop:395 length:198 start_codon:yes stop_codon:yes gene_type:complete
MRKNTLSVFAKAKTMISTGNLPALIIVVFLILRRTSSSSEVSANESYSKQEKLSKENEHYLPTDV